MNLKAVRLILALASCLAAHAAHSQNQVSPWTEVPEHWANQRTTPVVQRLASYRLFRLDLGRLRAILSSAPLEGLASPIRPSQVVALPRPDGVLERFRVAESPILSARLARAFPEVKTYSAQGIDDPSASARLGFTREGFHASVFTPRGDWHLDSYQSDNSALIYSYYRRDLEPLHGAFRCLVQSPLVGVDVDPIDPYGFRQVVPFASSGTFLKTYRLAMNATGEYTAYFGGVANANANIIKSVNRVMGVYERDFAIRFTLVYSNPYPSGATDPFTNSDGGAMLSQNQNDLDSKVGNANYDFGHVFSTGGGGIAGLGVVGVPGYKAWGVTGRGAPTGDAFDIDYVAHEMGHQFGANHTFNGTSGSCGGNRAASAAYEPGSGSTIMAYAGICGAEDLQAHSDAYFHTKSFDEVTNYRDSIPSVGVRTDTGNHPPTVGVGPDLTIPMSTPFTLTATGSDADGDTLTYCWEQFDLGTASPTTNNATRPLFRSFNPTTSPSRTFPRLVDILSGAATPWEILPNVARTVRFRCTVRDNRAGGGGVDYALKKLTVSGSKFEVTAPGSAVVWQGGSKQNVVWTVGGGSVASHVNILLSTNGGNSFGDGTYTVLKANTPNDGSETVTLPWTPTTQARIKVEAVGNVFFSISKPNFAIQVVPQVLSGTVSLENWEAPLAGRRATLDVRTPGASTPLRSVEVILDASGAFAATLASPLPEGVYDVSVKSSHWLRRTLGGVGLSPSGASSIQFALVNGDVDGDNAVTVFDYNALSDAFDSVPGDPNWNAEADLDGDGAVTIFDYNILSQNFDLVGDA